jgi:hypothetical protein
MKYEKDALFAEKIPVRIYAILRGTSAEAT